jgi:hypothetical protein
VLAEQNLFGLIEQHQSLEKGRKLVQAQEEIREVLTQKSPGGFYGDETEGQNSWLVQREESISSFGDDALGNVFPEEAHVCSRLLLGVLSRKGIDTISQLVRQKRDRSLVGDLGPMDRKMVNIITSGFSHFFFGYQA